MPRIDIDALEDEWEEEVGRRGRPPRREVVYSREAREKIEQHDVARVVGVDRGHVDVLHAGAVATARYAGSMRGTKVVVGDRVRLRPARHETDAPRVLERLDRWTVLRRTGDDAGDGDERVVVANADQVAVVLQADRLDETVGLLDRVLVAGSVGGLDGLVVVNKVDLVDPATLDPVLDRYRALDLPVVLTSAETGEGLDELRRELAAAWTAFAGHSGVGKSSLFNLLVPEADRAIGEVGRRGGRHTTVAARAMEVADVDAWLVDTPGVRAFGLGAITPVDLARHVPELAGLDCAMDDCVHDGEPGCRIDEADIHPARLASYRRLLAAVRGEDPWNDGEDQP
jgi:ribosome biogenesis GTPase